MKRMEFEQSFEQFYNKSYHDALYHCMSKTGDFINAEDILSDTYFALYKRMKKGKVENQNAYFYTILNNKIFSYWKKHHKELNVSLEEIEKEDFEELLEAEFDITAEFALRNMLIQDILEYISKQPAMIRRAFVIHFYFGKTIEETAKELDISVSNVRNYIYRLLHKIKTEYLEDYQ